MPLKRNVFRFPLKKTKKTVDVGAILGQPKIDLGPGTLAGLVLQTPKKSYLVTVTSGSSAGYLVKASSAAGKWIYSSSIISRNNFRQDIAGALKLVTSLVNKKIRKKRKSERYTVQKTWYADKQIEDAINKLLELDPCQVPDSKVEIDFKKIEEEIELEAEDERLEAIDF